MCALLSSESSLPSSSRCRPRCIPRRDVLTHSPLFCRPGSCCANGARGARARRRDLPPGIRAGSTLTGIVFHVLPLTGGLVASERPLIEIASKASMWLWSGGSLLSVAAGLTALGLASVPRFRRSVFLATLAVSSLAGCP